MALSLAHASAPAIVYVSTRGFGDDPQDSVSGSDAASFIRLGPTARTGWLGTLPGSESESEPESSEQPHNTTCRDHAFLGSWCAVTGCPQVYALVDVEGKGYAPNTLRLVKHLNTSLGLIW